jgi:asparagine N-glycosylation enzyme membrane subunit Stt3
MTKLRNIIIAAFSLVIFANVANAQEVKASYSVNAEEPLKVKYLGDEGEYLLFQVTAKAHEPSKAKFAISDKTEGTLYSSTLPTNITVTNVKVEKKDANQLLNFELFVGKEKYSKLFSVNTSVVETITVSERDITKL